MMPAGADIVRHFREEGYVGPLPVLTSEECRQFMASQGRTRGRPLDWNKSHAVTSRAFYELAAHPAIVDVVVEILGNDVMLWGSTMPQRAPNAAHPWHCDAESAPHAASTVSVWIGIKDVTLESSLALIPYSHRLGLTVQEERSLRGVDRASATTESVEVWARERDARCRLVIPEVGDGQAIFFDGQLWHGSNNLSDKTRYAILLQYATPSTEIRIPDMNSLDWPFKYLDLPRPPCIMIRGSGDGAKNRFVTPPLAGESASQPQLTSRAHRLDVPLALDADTPWKPYPLFRGTTANHATIACHASALRRGHVPHEPHRQREEEILLLLDGEVDLLLPDLGSPERGGRVRLKPGQFVYYPPEFAHSLEAVNEGSATYLMFKWYSPGWQGGPALPYGLFDALDRGEHREIRDGFLTRRLFEGPTACLGKLHAHSSILKPGGGYDPHVDAHDVAIVVLKGQVETYGSTYGPNSVIYFPAGERHGMRNTGEADAQYLVIEFHGASGALPSIRTRPEDSFLKKVFSLRRWKRRVRRVIGSLGS
ncbi:MAG TPA: cupin domain-containing protein [Rhodothermales bacterium]|nr:cupin domain-containing protein [Rhodothermales bacterium]